MQNGNMKVEDLFNGDRIFNIPKYQRTYSWDEENLESFIEDLKNQRSERNYFLGTLLFHQRENRGEYEIIDVVDGQQRLTTIIIFMKVLIKILKDRNSQTISSKTHSRYIYDGENYKLELENESNAFLQNYILSDEESICNIETPAQKKLLNAKDYFENALKNLQTEKMEIIFNVLKNAEVILYVVNQISEATKIFELLNDRGKKLTNLEGVKSYLMYRIGCLKLKDDGEQSINSIQDNISSIYRIVEKYNVNESDVLRYHTITFEKSKTDDYSAPEQYIKSKINKMFEKQEEDIVIKKEIMTYVEKLKESFDIYKDIKENIIKSKNLDNLEMIGRVSPFYPLMMYIYKNDRENFDDFVKSLAKFTFKAALIGLRNDNEGLYERIRDNGNVKGLFEEIINNNWWNINNRANEAFEYRNYYEWVNNNIVKYILFSYENYLRKEKGYSLLTKEVFFSTDKREKLSIEHITAQKIKNIVFDEEFKEKYLHSLGNLVIDTTSSNSRKNNDGVDEKMTEFIKAPLMSQNEISEYDTKWNNIDEIKQFIDKRNEKIVKFIKENLI